MIEINIDNNKIDYYLNDNLHDNSIILEHDKDDLDDLEIYAITKPNIVLIFFLKIIDIFNI